jgi:hypothetical protein
MKKNCWVVLVVLLYLAAHKGVQAQHLVRGIVLYKSDHQPVQGASISIKSTSNGTSSDLNGLFHIQIAHDTATLRAESIGFEDKELKVRAGDSVIILLKTKCFIDFFYQRYVEASLYSGAVHTPIGGKIKLFNPYVFEAKSMQPAIRTEIGYQLGGSNYQRSAMLAIDELVVSCGLDISVMLDYCSIRWAKHSFDFDRRTVAVSEWGLFGLHRFPVILGVGQASFIAESNSNKYFGAELGTKLRLIPKQNITVSGSAAWWQIHWQMQVGIERDGKRYSVAANFNKIGEYKEVNLRVGFKFLY